MRIRNLYNPPTLKDRDPVVPWVPAGMTARASVTAEGWEITVTGEDTGWLYPPKPRPDGLANVVWQKKDGSYLIGTRNNLTVPIPVGVTVFTRLCGFDERSVINLLQNSGLPLGFDATVNPS